MSKHKEYATRLRHFFTLVVLCMLWDLPGIAQVPQEPKLHSPAEIMAILAKSELTFEIGSDYTAALPDSPVVLSNQMYLKKEDQGQSLVMFTISEQARPLYDRAEEAFQRENFSEAILLYKQVLQVQPDYLHALTLIGDAFFSMQQFDSAKVYLLQSIELNFADYNAHWFLADTYKRLGKFDAALREATVAHLLNVNHSNLQKAVRYYRQMNKQPWKEWSFKPEYTLSKEGNKVTIKSTADWIGYALVKALWAHEPGYASSMLGEQKDSLLIKWPEEKEAILTLLVNKERFNHINEIVKKGFFEEFVLYEITAPRHPGVLVLLPHEEFMRIVKYVDRFH
jgi:tetratricopeptide (TPR) repeat protein